MNILWLCIAVGGTVGSLVPTALGAGGLSPWSIVGGLVGSFAGVVFYRRLDI